MRWRKYALWKAAVVGGGVLFLVLITLVVVSVADAQGDMSAVVTAGTVTVQATPTEDATMTALQKEQLILQNKQLQQSEDRGFGAWLWNNAAAIVASFLSTLVVVIGALIGLWQWRMNRDDIHTKESNDRKEAQDKDLRAQAEERFKTAVSALGDEKESVQVGGAILLCSFIKPGDEEIYGRYYAQVFDLAVAYLRPSNTSLLTEDPDRIPLSSEELPIPLPLTPLRQALIVVFREAFPLARERAVLSLDATGIQLDNAYLREADLKQVRLPEASLRKANLKGAILNEADLFKIKLCETSLTGADLSNASLIRANLFKAWFRLANLSGANLTEAELTGVNFNKADLSKANLRGANLSGTNLEEARSLEDADLREVKGLTGKQLIACKVKGAIVDVESVVSSIQMTVSPPPPPPQSP